MHLFGLTGGIASGKSAVGKLLRARGVPVIDADLLAREVVLPGSEGLVEVVRAFGPAVLDDAGALDRKRLAARVFGDEAERRRLNGILHPRIAALTLERRAALEAEGHPLACYEAALIVENGMADAFRPLVVVAAPEEVQVARATARDGTTADEARARVRAQTPLAEKVKVADFVIDNDASLDALRRRTDEVLAEVCRRVGVDPARFASSPMISDS